MEVQEYVSKMRKIYSLFLEFLDCSDDEKGENLRAFIDMINTHNILEDSDEIYEILVLISKVSKNHYRYPNFFDKIENILDIFTEKIKQSFTNFQIFNIFKSNKRILLILFNNKIIEIDSSILDFILNSEKEKYKSYKFYFFNEIKGIISEDTKQSIKRDLTMYDLNVFDNFHEKCLIGENELYICSLIRNDSIEEFIIYINQNNISLSNSIKPSIFETNSLLINSKENQTIIEYAAFFGSIQIFQFLLLNNVSLDSSLWKYSIHGRNPEIIHMLEENHINSDNFFFIALKCHHNEIAHYFKENFFENISTFHREATGGRRESKFIKAIKRLFTHKTNENDGNEKRINNYIINHSFRYHNYEFMPEDFNNKILFIHFCEYNYIKLVKLFLNLKIVDVNEKFLCQNKGKIYLTPLRISAENNRLDIINVLFKQPNVTWSKETFSYCNKIRIIELPSFIKEIDNKSFIGCCSLEKIIIPSSVTRIGDKAFKKCVSLKEILIPSFVNYIGEGVFNECQSLKKIELLASIDTIKRTTFSNCSSLKQITIPSSVTLIEFAAFCNCKSLEHITITSPKISIGCDVFNGCSSLVEISIPCELLLIGTNAFERCTSLKEVSISSSSSMTCINSYLFTDCISLINITIPSSVTIIKRSAFNNCKSLKQIILPSSVTYIGKDAFCECSSLEQIILSSSVTYIGENAFCGCSSLKQVAIPSLIESIESKSFYKCSSITQIEIPSHVNSIGDCSFYDCALLKEVLFSPSSLLDSINKDAFRLCKSLTEIIFPSSLTIIFDSAFRECLSLQKVSFKSPSSLVTISNYSFEKCSSLIEISFPPSLKFIGQYAFQDCLSLKQILFVNPSSITSIEKNAFNRCESLSNVEIPKSVESIGFDAFGQCKSLTNISIPSSIDVLQIGLFTTTKVNKI